LAPNVWGHIFNVTYTHTYIRFAASTNDQGVGWHIGVFTYMYLAKVAPVVRISVSTLKVFGSIGKRKIIIKPTTADSFFSRSKPICVYSTARGGASQTHRTCKWTCLRKAGHLTTDDRRHQRLAKKNSTSCTYPFVKYSHRNY